MSAVYNDFSSRRVVVVSRLQSGNWTRRWDNKPDDDGEEGDETAFPLEADKLKRLCPNQDCKRVITSLSSTLEDLSPPHAANTPRSPSGNERLFQWRAPSGRFSANYKWSAAQHFFAHQKTLLHHVVVSVVTAFYARYYQYFKMKSLKKKGTR